MGTKKRSKKRIKIVGSCTCPHCSHHFTHRFAYDSLLESLFDVGTVKCPKCEKEFTYVSSSLPLL